jgi:prophage antirepressor-like protein
MTSPTLFEFETLPVRVHSGHDGEPWFVAIDVANALNYRTAHDMTRYLEDDEKGTLNERTLGGEQVIIAINEAGLYSAILRSRKPEAKRFKRWITHEVLPSIRKTGSYSGSPSQNVHQQIALSRHRVSLLKELHKTRDRALRSALHEQLGKVSQLLGVSIPLIDDIGRPAPIVPDVLTTFWSALDELDRLGLQYNHSCNNGLLAVNLTDLRHKFDQAGIKLLFDTSLRRALLESESPRCVRSNTSTYSVLTSRILRCWVFEKAGKAECCGPSR